MVGSLTLFFDSSVFLLNFRKLYSNILRRLFQNYLIFLHILKLTVCTIMRKLKIAERKKIAIELI